MYCAMNMISADMITCRGWCAKCEREHVLTAGPAVQACAELMRKLEEKQRIDFFVPEDRADPELRTDCLFSESRGHMFGAMVYRDAQGREGVARAFSGQFNSVWLVDGWVPPVVDVDEFERINVPGEREVKAMSRRIDAMGPDDFGRKELVRERRTMSRDLMARLHELYVLPDFRGSARPIAEVFLNPGIPTGAGDCCAPKLLAHAARNGLTPLGVAEFFWGRENRSGTRQHRAFYPACEEKCQPLLGHMLCGLSD